MASNLTAPSTDHGVPIGHDGWRLVVEVELPDQPGAIVGTAVVGTTKVASGDVWIDITGHVQGLETQRGSIEFLTRGNPGTLTLSLDNTGWIFAPWLVTLDSFHGSARKFRSGLSIRVGLVKTGAWWPVFTGIVTDWHAPTEDAAHVTAIETITALAETVVDDIVSVDGAGYTTMAPVVDLFMSLVDPWRWGVNAGDDVVLFPFPINVVQVDGNVLAKARELVHVFGADTVRSDTRGRLEWLDSTNANAFYGVSDLALDDAHVVYDDFAAVGYRSDDVDVINSVTYRSGGDEETIENAASIARHGRRVLDIGTDTVGTVSSVGASQIVDRFTGYRERLEGVQVDDRHLDQIVGVELDQGVTISITPPGSPGTIAATGSILTTRHQITPVQGAVEWLTTYDINTNTLEIT